MRLARRRTGDRNGTGEPAVAGEHYVRGASGVGRLALNSKSRERSSMRGDATLPILRHPCSPERRTYGTNDGRTLFLDRLPGITSSRIVLVLRPVSVQGAKKN
ncbi:hypothetical protein GWI33_017293 [Rhynchophorus ferrugineus]|uniref:Uncharacterized protein n=1 Tax=Rhynchophorus ferrugineus TaxID=354439 RepID=A0A834HZF9_RHYFE|nr:hypothetical protein GWI33_017293 [Rhynchophorus ferrugineus]